VEIEKKQCDVLCVGGGIAGLMAAIRASELGAKVIVAEKSNTLRSGGGGVGNDHFQCYIPEVHGDFDYFWRELFYGQLAGMFLKMDTEYARYWFENTYDILKKWENWGIPMKYEGKYEFAGHGFPGKQLNHLKYSGQNQKPVLTRQALERGVEIVNRVMVFDLLKDQGGNIIGALGTSTREDKVVAFETKSVILGTGSCGYLYPPVTAGANNNRGWPMSLTGDGRAMAYRVGTALRDLELTDRHAGPKYFTRYGQATWVGVLKDRYGKPVGPFVTKPDKRYGDMTIEVSKGIFDEYKKSGRGPIYMDMTGISEKDLKYMLYWMINEGNPAVLNHLEEEGVDLRKASIEFGTFDMTVNGGIRTNYRGETGLKGLYAAGDDVWVTISHAATFGWSAGENAAKYAETVKLPDIGEARAEIEAKKAMLEEIRNREDGAKWQEALAALQQIMLDYCGYVRSESLLSAGIDIMGRLKNKAQTSLIAGNAHELMNCLQVLNLMDLGELVFISAYDRQETRGWHVRSDYTITNPLLSDKLHLVKQVDGKPVTEWIEVKR